MSKRDARWLQQRRHNFHGIQIRDCRRAWKALGGSYEPVQKTGETRWTHPTLTGSVVTGRGKAATRRLGREIIRLMDRMNPARADA